MPERTIGRPRRRLRVSGLNGRIAVQDWLSNFSHPSHQSFPLADGQRFQLRPDLRRSRTSLARNRPRRRTARWRRRKLCAGCEAMPPSAPLPTARSTGPPPAFRASILRSCGDWRALAPPDASAMELATGASASKPAAGALPCVILISTESGGWGGSFGAS